MKTCFTCSRLFTSFLSGLFFICAILPGFAAQDDTVVIRNVAVPPAIDGVGDDACWNIADWQAIDQVWINYGESIGSSDYSGRYKTVWSSRENLLYFLVEIYDDVAVDGFREGETADVYHYDIVEVFLDEDKSGGSHVFDDPGTQNAENAFSYHIYADFPAAGSVNKNHWVGDIPAPLTHHLPEFAIRTSGNTAVREFSLKVFDDTYEAADPEASRVTLASGKIMGLSLAYCDNDDNDGQRDNFFGSVWVTAENYNNHWMNADDYGTARLYSDLPDRISEYQASPVFQVYPSPASDYVWLLADKHIQSVEILDMAGKTLSRYSQRNANRVQIPLSGLEGGIFLTRIICSDNTTCTGKLLIF